MSGLANMSINNKMSLESENLLLKEAVNFAKRGWEDALVLLNKTGSEGLRSEEQQLEIKSLQDELDTLHKNMFHRAEQSSVLRASIAQATAALEARVLELGDLVKCPDSEAEIAEKMVEELSYSVDDAEEQLQDICRKLDAKCNRLRVITDFIRASSAPYDNGEHKAARPVGAKGAVKKKVSKSAVGDTASVAHSTTKKK